MRISSSMVFDVNVTALNQQQSQIMHTQQQITSGRRMLTAADDPAGAARVLELSQSEDAIAQYAKNIDAVQYSLTASEGALQSITSLLQDIHDVAVNVASPGSMSNADRQAMASHLQGSLDQMISLANSTDGSGNYMFSGFQGKNQPFASTAAGVQYMGDDGQRLSQVDANRQLAGSDSGADIFMRIKNGNGTFVTQAVATNTGGGIASQGNVVDPALLTGNNYQIDFAVAAGVTTYTVTNTTNGNPTVPPLVGVPYVSGQPISFDGMQFDIKGAPADLDQFTVVPSTNESVFKTISDLINTLKTPLVAGNAASSAQFSAGVSRALSGLDNSLNNVSTIRASTGSRLNELDALKITGSALDIQYKQAMSQLQDTDFTKAISELTMEQTMLEAAQKSFLQVMNLSMFNYMS